jgi:hypothetical protein
MANPGILRGPNFLKLIKCFLLFENVIKNHLEKMEIKGQHTHYFGSQVQNELNNLIFEKVKSNMIVKRNDYC